MRPPVVLAPLFVWAVLGTATALCAEHRYKLTDLGPISPSSINDSSQIAGNLNTVEGHVGIYAAGSITDIGPPGAAVAYGTGINNNGHVVGSSKTAIGEMRGFRYAAGIFTDLGSLGGEITLADAINAAGEIAGGSYLRVSNGFTIHAFRYSNGVMIDLGGPPGYFSSRGRAINNLGQTTGDWSTLGNVTHAFLHANGMMTDLGTLGGDYSEGHSINSSGQVVGRSTLANGDTHAFLYSGGTMTDLGVFGGTFSSAEAINDRGQIVGTAARAFLYEQGAMKDLNTLADVESSVFSYLYTAQAINGAGAIVGTGFIKTGGAHGYLLTPIAAKLANISSRAYCSTANNVTIGGYVISGSSPKQVLIRAVGPSLTKQGIAQSDVLLDPTLELHDANHGNTIVASNDNWGDASATAITAMAKQLGAAALDPTDTNSSALLVTLNPGVYSFVVGGKAGTSGIVLLEVYDTEAAAVDARFMNIASRAFCRTGDSVTIGGFVISGTTDKQVLLRAVGPTLTTLGIGQSEVLIDPVIELHDASHGNAVIGTNDNWGDNANASLIVSVGARIGAVPFAAGDTRSSALLLTLHPGVYSFIASGKSSTSGIVLVEVYDAD